MTRWSAITRPAAVAPRSPTARAPRQPRKTRPQPTRTPRTGTLLAADLELEPAVPAQRGTRQLPRPERRLGCEEVAQPDVGPGGERLRGPGGAYAPGAAYVAVVRGPGASCD